MWWGPLGWGSSVGQGWCSVLKPPYLKPPISPPLPPLSPPQRSSGGSTSPMNISQPKHRRHFPPSASPCQENSPIFITPDTAPRDSLLPCIYLFFSCEFPGSVRDWLPRVRVSRCRAVPILSEGLSPLHRDPPALSQPSKTWHSH